MPSRSTSRTTWSERTRSSEMVFAAAAEGRPVVIGHRGLGSGVVAGHRENTLGSFLAAVEAGVDWVEVDVRRTRDDRLVIAHDPAYDDGLFLVDADAATASARGTLLLDDLLEALPAHVGVDFEDRKSTRLNSSHSQISYAV